MAFFTVQKIEKLVQTISTARWRETRDIPVLKYWEGDLPGAQSPDLDDRAWQDFAVGSLWGGYDITAWFRMRIQIPSGWREKRLYLRFLVGPRDEGGSTAETMLYVNGVALQGIDIWHEDAWLPPETLEKDELQIALRAWSSVLNIPARRRFKLAQLVWVDEAAERFYYLSDTLLKTIKAMDENDLRRLRMLQALNQAFLAVDFTRPGSEPFYASIASALSMLEDCRDEWKRLVDLKPTVTGIGHAHIDMAWLWRLCHTRHKAARTFATALHLMRQYPQYRFLHSSPQLYQFLKQDYPELFERVRVKIAEGAWEISGATWVEPDTNIPSGESLVRQFLFGRRFAREEFGVEMKLLWLPDVFGYSAALPQIMKKSGIENFMTTKISWSQFNRFPYDTFRWRGLDGSEVLTHFITTPETGSWFYTYNGQLRPDEVRGTWNAYQQKEINSDLLMAYGWGDGGGGPTREMIEWGLNQENLPGQPGVKLDKAETYFKQLAENLRDKEVPVWDGELYLEFHRGTYTSQGAIKRANRKAEVLYHNAEWAASLADVLTDSANYPAQALNAGWERLLLNQFHDILPGSSIHPVYEDAALDYADIQAIGEQALADALSALAQRILGDQDRLVVFNSLSFQRAGLIELPWSPALADQALLQADGSQSPAQVVEAGGEKRVLFAAAGMPALGYRVYPLVSAAPSGQSMLITPQRLENDAVAIALDGQGHITSIFDKRSRREVIANDGLGNVLQVFEDKPMKFDAWDIDIYYQEKLRAVTDLQEAVVEEEGPLRGTLRLSWRFLDSTITQRIHIYAGSARIDFNTVVDWRQHQMLLKAAFEVNIRATQATYEVQFGSVERPTHWNTSWDWARFEVPGQKWADLSEGDYGVALLNDCKYGFDIKDNVMRQTLIKSGIQPNAQADQGRHIFTYSLLPHAGGWREGGVTREAQALNLPLLARARQPGLLRQELPEVFELAAVSCEHVLIDTVKRAEDGDGWIFRLYEYQQKRAQEVRLSFGLPLRRAVECNLMEENHQPVLSEANRLVFDIRPFEIKTFKVWF